MSRHASRPQAKNGSNGASARRRRAVACALALTVLGAVLIAGATHASQGRGSPLSPQTGQTTPAGRQAGADVPQPASSAPLRLAVVDLDRVFERSKEWQDHEAQRAQLIEKIRRTLRHSDSQIRILRSEYDDVPPGTAAASEKLREIQEAIGEFEKAKAVFEQQTSAQLRESLRTVFNKISASLEQYAKTNNIDLILKKQNLHVSSADPAEIGAFMAAADVLYVSDHFDVTEAVIKELNAEYPGEIKER